MRTSSCKSEQKLYVGLHDNSDGESANIKQADEFVNPFIICKTTLDDVVVCKLQSPVKT